MKNDETNKAGEIYKMIEIVNKIKKKKIHKIK